MKQKNKRTSRNKTNSINSNKAESNVGNDGKKGSSTKSSCDFKKLLCIGRRLKNKFMESKNTSEERKEEKDFLHKALGNLLNFHPLILSGISVVGMICYFAYFGFKLRYFPDLSGSDVAYVGVLLFFILTIISLFIILPCLVYPGYYKNKKNKTWMFYFWLSLLPFFTLVLAAALNYINTNKMPFNIMVYSLGGSIIYLFLVISVDKKINIDKFVVCFAYTILNKTITKDDKNNTDKIDRLITKVIRYIVPTIFSISIVFILYIIFFIIKLLIAHYSFEIEWANLDIWFYSTMLGFSIMTLSYFKGLEYFYKKNDYKLLLVTVSTVVLVILYLLSSGAILHWLGMTNIEYKYLSIEKSALDALPEKIDDIGKIIPFEGKEVFSYVENNLSIIGSNKKDQNLSISISPKYLSFSCVNNKCKDINKSKNIKFENNVLSYQLDKNYTEENVTVKIEKKEYITYIEKHDDTVWLHNIKAISTLGKFYYLETKDGIRFELDASKIISRKKQER